MNKVNGLDKIEAQLLWYAKEFVKDQGVNDYAYYTKSDSLAETPTDYRHVVARKIGKSFAKVEEQLSELVAVMTKVGDHTSEMSALLAVGYVENVMFIEDTLRLADVSVSEPTRYAMVFALLEELSLILDWLIENGFDMGELDPEYVSDYNAYGDGDFVD